MATPAQQHVLKRLKPFLMPVYTADDIAIQSTLLNYLPGVPETTTIPMARTDDRKAYFTEVSKVSDGWLRDHQAEIDGRISTAAKARAAMIVYDLLYNLVNAIGGGVNSIPEQGSDEYIIFAAGATYKWILQTVIDALDGKTQVEWDAGYFTGLFRTLYAYASDRLPATRYLSVGVKPSNPAQLNAAANTIAGEKWKWSSTILFTDLVNRGVITPGTPVPPPGVQSATAVSQNIMGIGEQKAVTMSFPWTQILKAERDESTKGFPSTLPDIINFNTFISPAGWWMRTIARVASAGTTNPRYDDSNTFVNHCYFPVIIKSEDGNFYGMSIPVVYSSHPLYSTVLRHQTGYTALQVDATTAVNIDMPALSNGNPDAMKAIAAALLHTKPRNMSYISFLTSIPLAGPSMGLAVALAVAGCPPVMATGFIYGSDLITVDDTVRDVQLIEAKFKLARREGYPIITSHSSISKTLNENKGTGFESSVYTSAMMMASSFDYRFVPGKHMFIAATSLPEAVMLACTAWEATGSTLLITQRNLQRRSMMAQNEARSTDTAAAGLIDVDSTQRNIIEDDGSKSTKKSMGTKKKPAKRYR